MDKLKGRVPINKTAALVVSKGVEYTPSNKVTCVESPNPLPVIPLHQLPHSLVAVVTGYIGKRRGRLSVVGAYRIGPLQYVMRCQCGVYVIRNSKTLRNEANYDMCSECRHLMHLKRTEYWRRTGKEISWQELDGVE